MNAPFRILFVCHGNICRSPMAEFVMRDLARKRGMGHALLTASAPTHDEEIGSPVHPGTRRVLAEVGIFCARKTARRLPRPDAGEGDLLVGMPEA